LSTANSRLPLLHLIDSICKNARKTKYPNLFETVIVDIFNSTFTMADEKIRYVYTYNKHLTSNNQLKQNKYIKHIYTQTIEVHHKYFKCCFRSHFIALLYCAWFVLFSCIDAHNVDICCHDIFNKYVILTICAEQVCHSTCWDAISIFHVF
jgi:hypothetical protein